MSASIENIANTGVTRITDTIQKPIPPVRPLRPGQEEEQPVALDQIKDSTFGSLFADLIQNVKDTDAEFTQAQYLLSTGQLDNPVQLGIAGYKAELSLNLLIQLRNRALDAYNELKNMNV